MLAIGLRFTNQRTARRKERRAKRWEPAMLEVLGGAAPPEAIHDRVDEKDGMLFLSFLLGYAKLLRGEERALVREMAAPYLPLVIPRLGRGVAESRGNAVLMLARMGMPTYATEVAGALSDPKLMPDTLTTDAGRNAFGRCRAAPRTLAHGMA